MEMLNPFKFKKDKQTDRQHVLLKEPRHWDWQTQ